MRRSFSLGCCLLFSWFLATGGQVTQPRLDPPDPSTGIIGVRIRVRSLLGLGMSSFVDTVYFVRTDEGGAERVNDFETPTVGIY